MLYDQDITIQSIIIHNVGNKVNGDNVHYSKKPLVFDEEINNLLKGYFLSSFKSSEYYTFYHDIEISMNEVYVSAAKIFDNPETILEESKNIAGHLYRQSNHPQIKRGELYVVYFNNCIIDGETVDAIGLFKSENRDTFLKVYPAGDGFEIESQQGVNINKLDKGCLIFNSEKENGYVVSVVDNTNKGAEAQYWIDDFLHIHQRKDEYYDTQNALTLCKTFIKDELPQKYDVSKADQADLINKSIKFFKEKDSFDMEEYQNEVIEQKEIIDNFSTFKDNYQKENEVKIAEKFPISDNAVKKNARSFKSIIKLDKNFHIYVHGNRNMIEQGSDVKGKFYKVYYEKES